MEQKLSDTLVKQIDLHDPFMQNLQLGKRYNALVDKINAQQSLKYHLYAWDYADGTAIAYSEKETPVAGDLVFLKEDMAGGKIDDPTDLKLIYHVVSVADGVVTVSEHPEGETGGYTFERNADDDYEEEITDVRDVVDATANGLLTSQKGVVFKAINIDVVELEQTSSQQLDLLNQQVELEE